MSLPLCGLCNCPSCLSLKQKRAQLGTAEQQAKIAFSSLKELDSGALGLPSVGTLQPDSLRESRSFIAAGNASSSCPVSMPLDTQMTLALLQELLMTLRVNDADGYKSWLALGIEELGREVAAEVESDLMVPLLVEEERDRLMAWQLGVSL